MKLIIDIPDEVLETKHYCQYFGAWSDKLFVTIENGTPYNPSGDCISREAFRKHYCKINCGERQCVDHADRCLFIDELMQFKTEPERPKGEWIEVEPHQSDLDDGITYREECSVCHEPNRHYGFDEYHNIRFATYYKTKFCPNCGAKMNGYELLQNQGAESYTIRFKAKGEAE